MRKQGFTLIELLVVISIIALLIAILLPSLSRARLRAREVVCMARVRTLGQTTVIMAQDRKGKLPDLVNSRARYGLSSDWSDPVVSVNRLPYWINPKARDTMLRYGMERDFFYCPNNDAWNIDEYWDRSLVGEHGSVWGYSYFGANEDAARSWDWKDGAESSPRDPVPFTLADRAFHNVIWTDNTRNRNGSFTGGANHLDGNIDTSDPWTIPPQEHDQGGASVGMVDGSVVWDNLGEVKYRWYWSGPAAYRFYW
ncbi:type II secretion system protein [Planctomycetales bacterium ZRK34]|nr:type II secretion system protein [Planctomycetales bacterium ZRK34]